MIRIMIVDDEAIIRESLATLIDWKSLGIEIVALCKNGIEAYDAVMDEYPDIILTDIQMPAYSGLKLIKQLTTDQANIEFIILSGFNDFKYAKEAMLYGVKHYLLKPCNDKELMDAILDVRKTCLSKNPQKSSVNAEKKFIKDALAYIDAHYADTDLTLKKIAEKYLFLSVNYVSKEFQIDTGMKFSNYLNTLRMEKAKDLLKNKDHEKIYEVADQVGCGNNPQYFSQLFKKYTGYTPKQYVKINLDALNEHTDS